jgi:hypothetical protein
MMTFEHNDADGPRSRRRLPGSLALVLALALVGAVTASAMRAAVPQSTAPPSVTGNAREGETLSASNGSWSGSPTKFAYQWQRCGADGTGCADVTGAQAANYNVAGADVDHTLRVSVTASSGDGQSTASSKTTDLVSARSDPANTVRPSVAGTARVGEELTASNGTWTGGVRSFAYQWQRCSSGGAGCTDVSGATGRTYGVRSADVGDLLQVVVTATNASGTTTATSAPTSVVRGTPSAPPVSQPQRNRPPTIAFLSLRRLGLRVYATFRVCDDGRKQVQVTERDVKAGRLGYTRRFAITPSTCQTASRHWVPAARFRNGGHGRLTITLRAIDKSGAISRTVSRGLAF